ncbi:14486_t:CDS:2, partial [Funneliformis caledonium]
MGLLMYQTMVVLTCLTKGNRSSCTFDIEVDTNVKVNRLKELIRDDQKHTFAKFDTSQLILWKINISNNRANEIHDLNLENDLNIEEMFGSEEIRKYFENVPNGSIHILVEQNVLCCPLHLIFSYESDKKVEELGDDLQRLTIGEAFLIRESR